MNTKNKKRLKLWLQISLIIYGVGGICIFYLQNKIMFHPKVLASDHKFNFHEKFEELSIPINTTDTINLVKFFPQHMPAKGLVIYFHGNRGSLERYAKFTNIFLRNGYEVWMPDYPGFGKSSGEISEQNLYKYAWAVRKLAAVNYTNDSVIIYGKSLGTAIAAYTATVLPNKMLVLETPYYSMRQVFRTYAWMYPIDRLIKYELPTYKFIDGLKSPVIIFHGTDDGVIRYSNAAKLKTFLKPTDQFFTIPGGSHRTININEKYSQVMDSLLQ